MNTIELQQTLPAVFAGRNSIISDVWHQSLTLKRGEAYLVEAASGTGKSSLCSYIYGYRNDYQGIICFDGKNIRTLSVRDWVEIRKCSISMLFQELRLFTELTAWENVQLKNSLTGFKSKKEIKAWFEQLDGDKSKRYMSVPIALTLNQPIFGVNNIKWDRRIEPVRYAEAKASFLSATENVTRTTINYFFNLLLAKENVNIARQNLENAQKLHEVAKAKRSMGQISENDLLQLELNVLDARSTLTDNESTLKSRMFQLRSFLALSEDEDLEPVVPESIPSVLLNYDDVLDKALTNNSFAQNIRRRQLEADYEVAKAKGDLREITLYAQVGFTGTNNELNTVYHNLKDNQIVEVGFKIPILDWGKRRGKVKIAKSNRDVVESRLRQETMNFNQDLFILVEQFNNQQMQLQIANEADKIAEKRYNTNVETFMIGKISTLDLNDSQLKKDEARQKHINELYAYWSYYYQIRSLTLWDFTDNTGIDADFEKIIKQ